MFKILLPAIFLMGNAFAEFNISNIKLTPTELEIVGDGMEEIKSVAIISNDSRKDFEINNVTSNQVNASPLDNTTLNEWRVYNLVISDSEKESTYPITISQKNGLITFYKLQEKETPVVKSPNKMVLDQINFVPGENNTGYDYNYSLYANPEGDFAIKGADKDLFTIDNEGNVEISGTLKIKGKQIGFNIPYLPIKEQTIPSNSANKVVFSAGQSKELVESGYTIPMNICPKGQILKSDGINFVCSLEASQEDQLGPVYTSNKSNFGIDQVYRELQINNLVIDSSGNITGALNFTSLGIMDVATATFHVSPGTGVGIGVAAPSVKLDILGATDKGIRLKQGGSLSNSSGPFSNGMVFEDSATNHAVGIGYSTGDLFSIIGFNGSAYNTVFTLNGTGNGVILGNLKIGAYTLPATDGTSGQVLKTNGTGAVAWAAAAATTTVDGPGTSTVGNIATWNNGTGTLLADGGKLATNLVTNAGAGTAGAVATFADASGKIIQNGTKLEVDLVTGPASASAVDNLASFNNVNGKVIKDSGISSANVSTIGIAPTAADQLILTTGTSRQLKATPYTVPAAIGTTGQVLTVTSGTTAASATVGGGDVVGTATATTVNSLPRYSSTTGKAITGSGAILDDTGALTGITSINGKTSADLVTMPTAAGFTGQVMISSAPGKALQPTVYTFPATSGLAGQVLRLQTATDAAWANVGTGDVIGPATSGSDTLAVFADTTGKLIKSVPLQYLNIVTAPVDFAAANRVALSSGPASKALTQTNYTIPIAAGTANQVLKSDGTNAIWQDPSVGTNTVQNLGAGTDNGVPRFNGAGGKEIQNSVVTIGDAGELAGVTSINGKTATDFVTLVATPTGANFVYLSNAADKVAKTTTYSFPPGPCAQDFILKTDVSGNFQCVAASASGVVSFNTRTGAVVAAAGDYTAVQVNSSPTGFVAATNVQAAIAELDTEKIPAAGGTMTGPLSVTEVRYLESGADYVGFKAPASLAGDVIWTLPPADGASGTVLSTDGAGILTWKTSSGGDVTGSGASVSGHLASYSGITGKIIQDSTIVAANVVTNAGTATATSIAIFTDGTGKLIQSSVVTIDGSGNMSGVGNIGSSGNLTVTGNLVVTGTGSFTGALSAQSYTNTSDRNLKKDIAPLTGGGDLIDKLMPVTFRWKKGDDRPVIGLIAQDVEKVLPDAITITKGKDGSIRSYDLGQVLALTIEALKETRAEVKKLQEKIKKLEQKKR